MTDRTGILPGRNRLQWSQVEPFFREHGCVVAGGPELGWYRESWGALEKANLTGGIEFAEFGLDRTVPRLRALCLVAMYLGIYRAAGEDSDLGGYFSEHAPCAEYLDSLDVGVDDLWEFVRLACNLETGAESCEEDEDVEDELLYELAVELVEGETDAIFAALVDHYRGKVGLFAALWNSRTPREESEPAEKILDSARPGDGRREVMAYVENGMTGWRLT